jgi:hypothetical protein
MLCGIHVRWPVVEKEQIHFAMRNCDLIAIILGSILLDVQFLSDLDLPHWVPTSKAQLPHYRAAWRFSWDAMPVQGECAMEKSAYPPSRHWEDWASFVVGLWLFISPWVLQYRETTAAQNAFVVGFLVMVTAMIALASFVVWEEWFGAVLGAWLVISPWIFGAAFVPMVNFVIVGFLILALALYVIWDERQHFAHPA